MKLSRRVGATSQIFQIFIADSSSTTGAGLTGLTNASSGLTAYFHRDTDTTATAISLVTMTVGTFTSSGFKEIDSTNMPGWYQFCPPNTALASGAASVGLHLKGATNMAPLPIEVDLDSQVDVYLWNGTAVSSPATAGIPDVNVKNINNVAAATPGASGGILISGSNSGTTTLGALTCTGSFTVSDGFLVSRSSPNASAITATGNGTGSGIVATSGSGATGDGIQATAASTNGNGFAHLGTGTGAGFKSTGGATGNGIKAIGGATSGDAITATTTAGDALSLLPTAGNALTATANGTSKHGIVATGGTAGTSDGIKGVAGTGGVDIRGNITGNVTGTVATVTTVTNQLTAAQVATGVWQDAAAGDFTTASSIGKSLYTSGVVPGGTNGLFIAGTNAATSITTGLTAHIIGTVDTVTTTTTATNLTNAPTAGDFTATMKTSLNAATPTVTTSTISSGAINAASINADTGLILRANTATAAAAGSLTLDAGATTTVDYYKDCWLVITSSTGIGQARRISTYSAGRVASVSPNWLTTPSATSTFSILPAARVDVDAFLGTASTGAAGSVGIDWAQVANQTSTIDFTNTTIKNLDGNTVQTGDSFARIGVAGVGLTNLGDTRIANLDAAVSSRMATYTQPTGFLAATFPSGTLANTTNITAGTITTATNLTNAATSGDLTATMKTSVTTAVNAATTVGVTSNRKKGSAATFEFLMQDATTGAPKTGLTVASTISKDGGASGATSNSVTEIGLGQYQIVLTAGEMTMNNGFLQCTATGALTFNLSIQTQP